MKWVEKKGRNRIWWVMALTIVSSAVDGICYCISLFCSFNIGCARAISDTNHKRCWWYLLKSCNFFFCNRGKRMLINHFLFNKKNCTADGSHGWRCLTCWVGGFCCCRWWLLMGGTSSRKTVSDIAINTKSGKRPIQLRETLCYFFSFSFYCFNTQLQNTLWEHEIKRNPGRNLCQKKNPMRWAGLGSKNSRGCLAFS